MRKKLKRGAKGFLARMRGSRRNLHEGGKKIFRTGWAISIEEKPGKEEGQSTQKPRECRNTTLGCTKVPRVSTGKGTGGAGIL